MNASNFKVSNAPGAHIQAPVKLQIPNSDRDATQIEDSWCLRFGGCLELGAWSLEFRRLLSVLVLLLLIAPDLPAASSEKRAAATWEHSIVTIEVARKQYDYYQPWSRQMRRLQKVGTVLADKQILTTADHMSDHTLVRLQKYGRGKWTLGEVSWIDYHANLAVVTTSDPDFWKELKAASLGGGKLAENPLQILRWREGNLENRQAEFNQYTVREGQLSAVNQVTLEISSEIQGAGWGEPVIADGHVIGLVRAQDGRTCTVTPGAFIESILQAKKKGAYHGLGFFHFFWQPAENPDTLAWLKLPGEQRGVVVLEVPNRPDTEPQVIKPKDVLLKIEGFDIDVQGDYTDPEFGHLNLENLSVRNKWAGDDVKIQVWRDGKAMDVVYRLPRFEYTNSLVPYASYDQEPEYMIVGGLVFQPLTDAYLQSWGQDWKNRAPFRLNYYNNESPTTNRPALVMLSQVLPDPYNIGYQDQRWLIVNKVNGQRVSRLSELRDALQKPTEGYHVLEFAKGESLQRMVLAAGEADREATARVLSRYHITDAIKLAK
jgi:hypothetical protein